MLRCQLSLCAGILGSLLATSPAVAQVSVPPVPFSSDAYSSQPMSSAPVMTDDNPEVFGHIPARQYHPMNTGMPLVSSYMNRAIEVTPYSGYEGTVYQGYAAPGGYEARVGSPYYYNSGLGVGGVSTATAGGDPYGYHFGPGFYRSQEFGHYRFPYYSYRRPWYHPGFANYNRDTNFHW